MSCTRYASMHSLRRQLIAGTEPKWLAKHPRADYIRQAVLSSPPWVDRKALRALRDKARKLTIERGEPYTLDHIVPLKGPGVCGLTVPWNLRVIPRRTNLRKGNAWCQWHGELFDQPEQLRLII